MLHLLVRFRLEVQLLLTAPEDREWFKLLKFQKDLRSIQAIPSAGEKRITSSQFSLFLNSGSTHAEGVVCFYLT